MQDQPQRQPLDAGGSDAVRESTMAALRAGIRERQLEGAKPDSIRLWIDGQEAAGKITGEEAAIARLVAWHYSSHDFGMDAGKRYLDSAGTLGA